MAISRRFFLKSGTLTAIVAGVAFRPNLPAFGQALATSLGYQIPITAQEQPALMFTRATFDPYVGGIFQTPDARGRMVSLKLLSATSNEPANKISTGNAPQTDSFSLMFQAQRALQSTSIYTISHPSLGKFDLFLAPHPQDSGVMLYEAVFNHI